MVDVWITPTATTAARAGGALKLILEGEGTEKESRIRPLAENPDPLNWIEIFPLDRIPPGYYKIVAVLLDQGGQEIDRQQKDFQVSTAGYVPRPWVYLNSLIDAGGPALIDNILGRQWAAKGEYRTAVVRLEKAYLASPTTRSYAVDLAQTYLAVLQPYVGEAGKDFDLGVILADTHRALGEFPEALQFYP